MPTRPDLSQILFLDIETASEAAHYDQLSEEYQDLWKIKAAYWDRDSEAEMDEARAAEWYQDKAGIYAEFARVVCISVGFLHEDKSSGQWHARLKSFADEDEQKVLADFAELLGKRYNNLHRHFLCGHNIKEFDIPFICRRMVKHGMPLPRLLDLSGLKPWETGHLLDTMEMWKFGDRKNFTSLRLLAAMLGFPSPKSDIDGSEVGRVFWEEKDIKRIAHYCEKDVLATIQLLLRYRLEDILGEDQVEHVEN